MKGFNNIANIPMRRFSVELKYRPPEDKTGENEELIDTFDLYIPRLKNARLESQWAFTEMWKRLESDYKNKGINQIFLFTAEFKELIARMEVNSFEDETAHKIDSPTEEQYQRWINKLEKRFKFLYGISIDNYTQLCEDKKVVNKAA